jgi:hypothetical protein
MGIFCYEAGVPNGREYLSNTLLTPISSGRSYYAEFYARIAQKSAYAVPQLALGTATVTSTLPSGIYPLVQVGITSPTPITAPINSNTAWTLVNGGFTATANAANIVIGNFQPDPAQPIPGPGNGQPHCPGVALALATSAYYYIDNVALHAIDAGPDLNLTCGNQTSPTTLGGPALPATANATYSWAPQYGLDNPYSPNPQVIRVGGTITYILTVTINGQPFTDRVTVNGSGVCPCDHAYQHKSGTYQAPTGNADYEIGTPGQLTILNGQNYPNQEITFEGTYHVLGPVLIENGTAKLLPGTTFYVDPDASYLVSPSCYPTLGLDEFASRIYVGKGATLELQSATVASTCDKLWGGITLRDDGILVAQNGSVIRDAYVGVMAGEYCDEPDTHYYLDATEFKNCYYGFVDLQKSNVKPGEGVTNCNFSSDPTAMLAPYTGKYTDTGLIIDGPSVSGLLLQYNAFDNLVTGASVGGYQTLFDHNTFTRCYFRSIGTGVFHSGLTYSRKQTLHANTIYVPNASVNVPGQIDPADLVVGIVLNDPNSGLTTVTRNFITSSGATPTLKKRAGLIGYSFENLTIRDKNEIQNLDFGVQLQDVGTYLCTGCTPGFVPTMIVADNVLTNNVKNVDLQGNPQYAYGVPEIVCNTIDNSALGGINYGIYINGGTWMPDLGSSSARNANKFSGATRSVWNDGGNFTGNTTNTTYPTTYWGYNTENAVGSSGGPNSTLTLDLIPTHTTGLCNSRTYVNAGLNRSGVTAQVASSWQQQLHQQQGSARDRWYLEQDLLQYYHATNQQATLDLFVRTLPGFNDSAFYRLSFYLLGHYRRSGQDAAAQRLRAVVLRHGSTDANVVHTLAYTEVMHRLARSKRGLEAADSLLLAKVALSGTRMADAACLTLRTFYPQASCGAAPVLPSPRQQSATVAAKPRISGLYPNPAAHLVRVRCAVPAGAYQVVIRDLRTGKVVGQSPVEAKDGIAQLNVLTIPAGLYACQLEQDGRVVATESLQIAR